MIIISKSSEDTLRLWNHLNYASVVLKVRKKSSNILRNSSQDLNVDRIGKNNHLMIGRSLLFASKFGKPLLLPLWYTMEMLWG